MAAKTVEWTAENALCSSCGICKNVCPQKCIELLRDAGKYQPHVEKEKCVHCGLCLKVCPGEHFSYPIGTKPMDGIFGTVLESYNAWSKDPILRHVSASGGVVSTLIEVLLQEGEYDTAFCVDSYHYEEQLKTKPIQKGDVPQDWALSKLPKSRYLPVSHENAVSYILENRDKRVILIGTACAVRGFRQLIDTMGLEQEHYLLIGLFCDKVFNYNIQDYFQRHFAKERKISQVHFKNKDSGGWPGNIKIMYTDGTEEFQAKEERTKTKEFFMPERCLFCIDKLNVEADISVGDNYTGQDSSELGSNSVLIRTEKGRAAWRKAQGNLTAKPFDPALLRKAQYLDGRINQFYFSLLKQQDIQSRTGETVSINQGIQGTENPIDFERAWKHAQMALHAGEVYREDPDELQRQYKLIERRKNPKSPLEMGERVYYALKRRIKKS